MNKKITLLKVTWGIVLLCWLLLIGLLFTGPDINTWTIGVTGVAVVTEMGFWITAGTLGVSMWESRKRIFSLFAKPFRRG